MQKIIYNTWNVVMNHNINPLKNIPNTHVKTYSNANLSTDVVYSIFYVFY